MTAPRWIAEALDRCSPIPVIEIVDTVAMSLLEHLPLERLHTVARETVADISGRTEAQIAADVVTDVVKALAEDADVVSLAELYQNAARALDAAGVPYGTDEAALMDMPARIQWLAKQRPIALDLQRVEAERDDARRAATECSLALGRERIEREADRVAGVESADAMAAQIQGLTNALEASERDKATRLERISALADQLDAANDAGAGFQRAATELEQEIAQTVRQRDEAREQLAAAFELLRRAEQTCQTQHDTIEQLRKIGDARKRTIDEYIDALARMARVADDANCQIEAHEAEITDLEEQLYEDVEQHDERDDRIAALEDEVERLEAENADLEAAADSAREENGGP